MAAQGISMKEVGSRRLLRKFGRLPNKIRKKAIRTALRDTAKVVAKNAKRDAPRDTGHLARIIKVRAMKRSRRSFGILVKTFITDAKKFYGAFQEFGTKQQPGQAFLRPALRAERDDLIRNLRTRIRAAIRGA